MDAPVGTVTFVFSDIEGSTRRWQDEPDAMRSLLVEHDAIWRDVIEKRHGWLFKHTGDGVAAVFASAGDAVNAAVDAQARLAGVLAVRVGLHTGEAELRDGDYFGSTLNRCARLMGVAHGGQIVISESTAGLVRDRDDLHDLGEHRLRDLSRAEHVWQVGGGDFAALRSLDNYSTNLPLQLSSFVGRSAEVASISALLAEDRLVTLTGVGGVGKTRLALTVGAEVLPRFADGVWVVELAPLVHDELVVATVADVLGVAAQAGEPLAVTLVRSLRARELLLILDNCEHVLGAVAGLVERVASAAPGVRMLATSREPLGIAAERVRAVPPLAEGTEAVELFVDRAAHAGATFDSPEQQRAIGEICVRLDGIPLAIELAAARARMMAPTQIAERLDQRFRLLTGGGRTAVERHRTLQATVSWSYELLDETERLVFQRLSTLAGSFDIDAAEGIAAGGAVEDFEVLDALGHLVDKSMVFTVPVRDGVRYRMLETLRQFAADRLAEQPDALAVRDRHAGYWCARGTRVGRITDVADENAVYDAIDADFDNYRSAFAYLLAAGRVDDAAAGVLAIDHYVCFAARVSEGLRWVLHLLTHPDLADSHRYAALGRAAHFESATGDVAAAERHAVEAIALAEAAGLEPDPWPAYALMMVAVHRGDAAAFRSWYEQSLAVATATGSRHVLRLVESQRGIFAAAWDTAELIEHYERLATQYRRGDEMWVIGSELIYANMLFFAGRVDEASERSHMVVEIASRQASSTMHTAALTMSAAVDALGGNVARSRVHACELLPLAHREGQLRFVVYGVFVAAALASQSGDFEAAAVLLAASAGHAATLGIGATYPQTVCRAHAQAAVDAHSGDLTAARRRGAAMTIDELVDFALESLR